MKYLDSEFEFTFPNQFNRATFEKSTGYVVDDNYWELIKLTYVLQHMETIDEIGNWKKPSFFKFKQRKAWNNQWKHVTRFLRADYEKALDKVLDDHSTVRQYAKQLRKGR